MDRVPRKKKIVADDEVSLSKEIIFFFLNGQQSSVP